MESEKIGEMNEREGVNLLYIIPLITRLLTEEIDNLSQNNFLYSFIDLKLWLELFCIIIQIKLGIFVIL